MNVYIREAVMGDAELIGRLVTELGYPTTTAMMRERLTAILSDPNYVTLVADADADTGVVGVIGATLGRYYEKDGSYSRIVALAVATSTRERGIGNRLVEAIERWSASKGVSEVFVNSGLHRTEAHHFYERRGYSRTGFRFVKELKAGE